MGRFGLGFGALRGRRRGRPAGSAGGAPPLFPAAGWTGAAGSGFTTTPSDPVRTTAKPALRMIVPPNQAYTDTLLVGVTAWANDSGSLLANCGLTKVTAYCEGNSVDIAAPSFQTFADANGNPVTYFGWWVTLERDGRDGYPHLYFEATPRDATMQHRVIGPFQFAPRTTLHDWDKTVPGDYATLDAAIAACKAAAPANPRITITAAGTYDASYVAPSFTPQCYLTIAATAPVTIKRAAFADDGGNGALFRPRVDGIRFKGSNITIDMANYAEIYMEGTTRFHWFDGCNVISSAGEGELWRGGPRPISDVTRTSHYATEATFRYTANTAVKTTLCRGNTYTRVRGDLFSDAACVIGCSVNGVADKALNTDVNALTVRYMGGGGTGTLEISGTSIASSRTITARVAGVAVGTFTVATTAAAWIANTRYTVRNVADWLNGVVAGDTGGVLAGWSATVVDDSRRASGLSLAGSKGVTVPRTDVTAAPVTLVTYFDYHGDFYQHISTISENVVVADNVALDLRTQNIFIASSTAARDFMFLNNAFWNDTTLGTYWDPAIVFSQQYGGPKSHVVVAHNSMPDQQYRLRTADGYEPDAFCLNDNNVFVTFTWSGNADSNVVNANNHLLGGATAPAGATGTTIGGTAGDLFADAPKGDFTPAGALLANLKPPALAYDRKRKKRGATAPAGAVA